MGIEASHATNNSHNPGLKDFYSRIIVKNHICDALKKCLPVWTIDIPPQCCSMWRHGFTIFSRANPERNHLVVTGNVVLKNSLAVKLVGNAFRGKRDVQNCLSIWCNITHVKDIKIGPSSHLEDVSTPFVCGEYTPFNRSGIKITKDKQSTRDVSDLVLKGVNHTVVVCDKLIGRGIAGKESQFSRPLRLK